MKDRSFVLQPFPTGNPQSHLKLRGKIARRYVHTLSVCYMLVADLEELAIPETVVTAMPTRKDGIWKETCFELFLAACDRPCYWELNLSPAGHWNVYRFEAYRQGMKEESGFASLPFAVQTGSHSLLLSLELDLAWILPAEQAVDVAISAVIKHRDGELTYWALTHPGPKPDFHRRDGFSIRI